MKVPKCGYYGLNRVISESHNLHLYRNGYLELFLEVSTRRVWTVLQTNYNSWTDYYDDDIVRIGTLWDTTTRANLIAIIDDYLEQRCNYGC